MKTKFTLFIAVIAFSIQLNAQITVDAVYPDANRKLYIVDLEISGMKYIVKSDVPGNRFLKLYHLDHSLWKTIDCNSMPTKQLPSGETNYNFDALYISETLFDCDDMLEFLYFTSVGYEYYTGIYNENGVSIMEADSASPLVKLNIPQQYRPIYNTPDGTKMILSHMNGHATVYDLPCELSTGVDRNKANQGKSLLEVYPNPAIYQTTIKYSLPSKYNNAEIAIIGISGQEFKRYEVDRSFSELLIETGDIAPGTYLYSLIVDGVVLESKKIILL